MLSSFSTMQISILPFRRSSSPPLEQPDNVVQRHEDSLVSFHPLSSLFSLLSSKIVQEGIYDEVLKRLCVAYEQLESRIGDPLDENVLLGPLHTKQSVQLFQKALEEVKKSGGKIAFGGEIYSQRKGNFVQPTIVTDLQHDSPLVHQETFVPILYLLKCQVSLLLLSSSSLDESLFFSFLLKTFEEAVQWNNEVNQGLSSSLFTQNCQHLFEWIGPQGSDCGIVRLSSLLFPSDLFVCL